MKEKTKRGCTITLIVLGSIVGAILLFIGILAIINVAFFNQHIDMIKEITPCEDPTIVPTLDEENNTWTFVTDEEFKVMQLTDVHIGGGAFSKSKDESAINAVATMIQAEKPDLVIVTGDIVFPVPYASGTLNNLKESEIFATLMEQLNVYWAIVFGNHDTELYSYYTREDLSEFYSQDRWEHCLYLEGDENVDGYGNYVINVENTKGMITHSFVMMDSHAYTDGDYFGIAWKYDNIHENQVEWYKNTINELNAKNKAAFDKLNIIEQGAYLATIGELEPKVKSSIYIHIPLVEYRDAWTEYKENNYQDTESVEKVMGVAGEKDELICCGVGEDNLFETMLELDSTKYVFCGHDHLNNFVVNYKGVTLSYGMSIDYLAYPGIHKQTEQRGCNILTLAKNGDLDIAHNKLVDYQKQQMVNYVQK